jgi:hypothetical protein
MQDRELLQFEHRSSAYMMLQEKTMEAFFHMPDEVNEEDIEALQNNPILSFVYL